MIIDIVCTFSATTIQAETKSVSLVLTFPATQLPSNICEEVRDCLGISESGEADYFLNEQGDWVQVQGGGGGGAVDSVNGQTGVVVLDTDDIQDTANNRYTNDTDITRLANTSGTNTGDQNLSGLVPYTDATQNVDLGTYNIIADQVQLNVTPSGTLAVGMTEWNDTVGVSQTLLKGGSVTLKNGVDLVARVVNKVSPNTTLTKAAYQVVKISGAQGQRLAVDLAQANNDNNSADTLGVVTETIAPNQEGFIMTVGQIENINTTGSLQGETWTDGDVLYLSPTVAGRITNVKPTGATGHIVIIGYVEYAHANNGKIYVKIMNGWELDELHNVYINTGTLANNDALIYESSTQLWKNKTIATALGFTPENVANKQNSLVADGTGVKYPTVDAINTLVASLPTNFSVIGVPTTNIVATGLAVETALFVIPLPVNSNNYLFRLLYQLRVTGTPSILIRVGTYASPIDGNIGANSIGQQTQLATFTPSSTNFFNFTRTFQLQGGASGTLNGRTSSQNIFSDNTTVGSITQTTVDTTVQQYFYITASFALSVHTCTLYGGYTQQIKMN